MGKAKEIAELGDKITVSGGTVTVADISTSTFSGTSIHSMQDVDLTGIAHNMFLKYNLSNTQFEVVVGNTSSIDEGTNLYYTDARVASYLSGNDFDTATNIVASITDSAPGTLDTLNELASALGDDANFSTTVTNSIATKLPLAGGTLTGNLNFGTNDKAIFGAGSDLQIYHNGSHSYIDDVTGSGTGSLYIKADQFYLNNTNYNYLQTNSSGDIRLKYQDATKLATTSTGIDVTGTVTSDGLTVTGTNGNYTIAANGNDFYYGRNGTNYHIANTANGGFQFLTGSSSLEGLRITSAQNVNIARGKLGIGMTGTPTSHLDIRGSGDIDMMSKIINTQQTTNGRKTEFLFGKDNGANLSGVLKYVYDGSQANRRIDLVHYGTSNGLSILDGGNVGIGTTNPSSQYFNNLVVGNNDAGDKGITIRSNPSNKGVLAFSDTDAANAERYSGYIAYDHNNNSMQMYTNGGSERMRIDAGGVLNVTGAGAPITPTIKHSGIDAYLAKIRLINRSGQYIDKGGLVELGGITNDEVTRTDVFASVAGLKATTASNNRTGYMQFSVNDGSTLTERMRIDSSGNVGIGETNPAEKLEVSGNIKLDTGATQYIDFKSGTSGAKNYRIYNGVGWNSDALLIYNHTDDTTILTIEPGKLGINRGASSLTQAFEVNGGAWISGRIGNIQNPAYTMHLEAAGTQFLFLNNASTNDGIFLKAGTGESAIQTNGGSHTMNFYTAGSQRLRIDSNGKIISYNGHSRGTPFPNYFHKRSGQLTGGNSSKKKARVGRIYWTGGHWTANGVNLHARVGSEYYDSENRLYHFSANYTDGRVTYQLIEPHSKHSNNTRIYLGEPTNAHIYAGAQCKYQDIWVEANNYKRVHVDFTSLGKTSGHEIQNTNITSGWGGVVVYDAVQDSQDVANFTDELINHHGEFFIATSSRVNDNLNQGEYFGFDQIQSGSSLNFNTSTFKYKIPIEGVYLFGANVYRNSSVGGNISFRKTDSAGNNSDDFGRYVGTLPSGDQVYVIQQMKRCNKGDLVGVYNYGGTFSNFYGASDDKYSSFYGHLIRSTM